MEQALYDIYFTGKLVDGVSQDQAQQNTAKLFKTDNSAISRLFDGTPQVLKRGISKEHALKYKAALHKAGLLVTFKIHNQFAAQNGTPEPQEKPDSHWTLAPVGSDLLTTNERKTTAPREIDTSSIQLTSPSTPAKPADMTPTAPPAPDTSHISVAAAGEDLVTDKPTPPPALEFDLKDISLAPPGADLEELHEDIPPLNPDTSGISIAPAGADLVPEKSTKTPPPAPDTGHLSIIAE